MKCVHCLSAFMRLQLGVLICANPACAQPIAREPSSDFPLAAPSTSAKPEQAPLAGVYVENKPGSPW